MKKVIFILFNAYVIIRIVLDFVFLLAAAHGFRVSVVDGISYVTMLGSVVLVSLLPLLGGLWERVVRFFTLLFLAVVIVSAIAFWTKSLSIEYEEVFVGILFTIWDLSFIAISSWAFYFVLRPYFQADSPVSGTPR